MPPNIPPDLIQILTNMEERLRALESGNTIRSVEVASPQQGTDLPYLGVQTLDGEGYVLRADAYKLEIQRDDGTTAMQLGRVTQSVDGDTGEVDDTDRQAIEIYDPEGNNVLGSTNKGQGLARPHLPLPIIGDTTDLTQYIYTTSATDDTLRLVQFFKQHSKVYLDVYLQAESATSGVFSVYDNAIGAEIDAVGISSGAFVDHGVTLTLSPDTNYMYPYSLGLRLRRTGGVGRVGMLPVYAYGVAW